MSDSTERLAQTLKRNGFSVTKPRVRVFETLNGQEPLPLSSIVNHCQDIDRASVYRTITLFENLGIIRKVPIGWKYRYELTDVFSHHHHHAVCVRCGALTALPESTDLEQALATLTRSNGFVALDHEIEVRGYCEACQPA